MKNSVGNVRLAGYVLILALLLAGYWLLPIDGQVIIRTGGAANTLSEPLLPQFHLSPANAQPGERVRVSVTDDVSWAHVLLTVNGAPAAFDSWEELPALGHWQWHWDFIMPDAKTGETVLGFYHDCQSGCQIRGQMALGRAQQRTEIRTPTKLCTVFPDPERDWHERQGWSVDLTYARLADDTEDPYWGIDQLAARTHQSKNKGLRVLVRVDYDRGQSLPPADDQIALREYLAYVERLARDDRLHDVYGYIIGSGMNALDANILDPAHPVTPEWYARIFNGYGEPPNHTDNVAAILHSIHPGVRLLVGPVRPWIKDQSGEEAFAIDVPWLNYMNALVAALDAGVDAKAHAGYTLAAPDGFALQTPGRPNAPELDEIAPAEEPRQELSRIEWQGAQAGFQVYQDWISVIDSYPSTRGAPVYLTAVNTFAPDDPQLPLQNYPPGWLTTAYDVVRQNPRVQSLCWFLDLVPGDDSWDAFSLTRQPGRMIYAAEEFDALLWTSEK